MSTDSIALKGGCYCGKIRYDLNLASKDDARTSLCHCKNCKKAFGGVFGVTVKVPVDTFKYVDVKGGVNPTVSLIFYFH